jgi:hypothetical protein
VNSIKVAEFSEVHMLSYQKFINVPDFVIQVDAAIVMAKERFLALYESGKAKFPVKVASGRSKLLAHSPVISLISDWIRFKYAGTFTLATCDCVTIIDADALWLKAWTSRGFMGFSFASCLENPTVSLNMNPLDRKLQNQLNYGRTPGDGLRIRFPAQFVVGHQILQTINDALECMCPVDGQWGTVSDWNYVMNTFLKAVNQHGLRDALADPNTFCAMHWYWREMPVTNNVRYVISGWLLS